jgi:hypothetical protein
MSEEPESRVAIIDGSNVAYSSEAQARLRTSP